MENNILSDFKERVKLVRKAELRQKLKTRCKSCNNLVYLKDAFEIEHKGSNEYLCLECHKELA